MHPSKRCSTISCSTECVQCAIKSYFFYCRACPCCNLVLQVHCQTCLTKHSSYFPFLPSVWTFEKSFQGLMIKMEVLVWEISDLEWSRRKIQCNRRFSEHLEETSSIMSDVHAYLSLNYRSEILGLTYRFRALNLSLDVIKLQLCAHNSVMESVKGCCHSWQNYGGLSVICCPEIWLLAWAFHAFQTDVVVETWASLSLSCNHHLYLAELIASCCVHCWVCC